MKKQYHPPHIYLDNTYYFITSRTFDRIDYFSVNSTKDLLRNVIFESTKQLGLSLIAWVILSNHYHILVKINSKEQLPKLVKLINGRSSRRLKNLFSREGRLISLPSGGWRVWSNYWERGVRDERDFYNHLNYIHHNPVKHGLTKEMSDYQFSSYQRWQRRKGDQWLESCFKEYPIIDFTR